MERKWSNLFWQLPAPDATKQREINTTKNFLKTLQDAGSAAERAVVKSFWNEITSRDLPAIDHVTYGREYSGDENNVDATYLIGISRKGRPISESDLQDVEQQGGQADASLIVETDTGSYQFVLEIKTGRDALDTTQLGKYCNEFEISQKHVGTIQWRIILETCEAVRESVNDPLRVS